LVWMVTAVAAVPTQFRRFLHHGQVESTPAVAVCLYGPAAGMLAVTRSSLWARLLDVLAYHGWRADVYVHTMTPGARPHPGRCLAPATRACRARSAT
jgi:uncharacterized membrane protein